MPLSVVRLKASAEDLRTMCATTPGMNAYQPIATSGVEICVAAENLVRNDGAKLAGFVVDQTGFLINRMARVLLSPEICQALAIYEEKLDAIRRYIENISGQPRTKKRFITALKFKREISRFKADVKSHLRLMLAICDYKPPALKGAPRSEYIIELVSMSTRAVGAICDVPILNVMKPVVGVTALICDTAKCVQSNREAARDLAMRASAVTRSVVDRVAVDGAYDPEALEALKLALEEIQSYLTGLKKPRRRVTSWVLANQEKDRFARQSGALDRAVMLFSATQVLGTAEEVRANAHTAVALVATVGRLDANMTMVQTDLGKLSIETPVDRKNNSFRFYCIKCPAHFFLDPLLNTSHTS
ncbi:hypothetical protein B0H11DRAFT_2056331 [Mycena galericulata]|nr:hypothetical protein B0H11DRAFT_2056331 [Mycena galericulata]